MSDIAFFCIPAHGHTNPTLGVVRELVSRGHRVWYYSYHSMREKIEAAGGIFISCDDCDAEPRLTQEEAARVGKDMALSIRLLVDTTLALNDKVLADMEQRKPDCIVADSMAVWGKAVARKLSIPFVSSTTTFAFNRYSAKIMKQGAGDLLKLLFSLPEINRNVKRLQEKGYPVKGFLDLIRNDEQTDTIVYTSPEFQPCADTFSDKYAFVGPSIRPAGSRIEKTGKTLIYISMGTVNNNLLPLYRRLITALGNTAYQVIMSVGTLVPVEALGPLPENVSAFSHVDQIAVLQQADLFISHCGMNSVSESLYFGVPLVMLPQTAEQQGVAARVRQLGAGVPLDQTDPESIKGVVESVLSNAGYRNRAAMLSESFRRCSGAKGAADKIEQVCASGVSV